MGCRPGLVAGGDQPVDALLIPLELLVQPVPGISDKWECGVAPLGCVVCPLSSVVQQEGKEAASARHGRQANLSRGAPTTTTGLAARRWVSESAGFVNLSADTCHPNCHRIVRNALRLEGPGSASLGRLLGQFGLIWQRKGRVSIGIQVLPRVPRLHVSRSLPGCRPRAPLA